MKSATYSGFSATTDGLCPGPRRSSTRGKLARGCSYTGSPPTVSTPSSRAKPAASNGVSSSGESTRWSIHSKKSVPVSSRIRRASCRLKRLRSRKPARRARSSPSAPSATGQSNASRSAGFSRFSSGLRTAGFTRLSTLFFPMPFRVLVAWIMASNLPHLCRPAT